MYERIVNLILTLRKNTISSSVEVEVESDGGIYDAVVGESDVGTCVEVEEESYESTCDLVVVESDDGTYILLVGENGACGEDDGGACVVEMGLESNALGEECGVVWCERLVEESDICRDSWEV
ncbi:hypothetical protein Lal_00033619 [Lupinus albus]|nr:hypothetical protein Lal_00033619 [Lupinus albus]